MFVPAIVAAPFICAHHLIHHQLHLLLHFHLSTSPRMHCTSYISFVMILTCLFGLRCVNNSRIF